jgi:hypothetical protein
MSTNLNEMTESLLNRQKEKIEELTHKLEMCQRKIFHYEHIVQRLKEESQSTNAIEIEKIKATSDFIKREYRYVDTIKNLTKDKIRLEAEVSKSKEESKSEPVYSGARPLYITPSFSNIRNQEPNILYIAPIGFNRTTHASITTTKMRK